MVSWISRHRGIKLTRRDEKPGIALYDFEAALPLFEQFLEFVPDAVVGVSETGAIVLCNQHAEQLFGYDRNALIGRPLETLVPKRFRTTHVTHRADHFAHPVARPMGAVSDLRGVRSDGSEFPVDISLSNIVSSRSTTTIAVVHDIADRVSAERERTRRETELKLNQSRRLESIGRLTGDIARDFDDLLDVIVNHADIVSSALEDRPNLRDDAERIRVTAGRAAALTRQLSIYSSRETARPLNLNVVLGDLEKLLRRSLGERVELVTRFDPDLWTVFADPGQIEQIALNLAVNASDAMPEGGTLEIETANTELDEEHAREHPDSPEPGRYVRLTVTDTGSGMPPEVVARAFEPFFSTKHEDESAGLGLATVRGIVTATGGNVFLSSEEGHGTKVKIHLPAGDLPAPPAPNK